MTGYAPLDTLKPVAEGLWLIDGPPVIRRRLPLPSRATVVRLADGGLWVHAPTPLTEGLRVGLDAIGAVAHLVIPGADLAAQLPGWQAAWPEARVWTLETLPAPSPWVDEIDCMVLHAASGVREAVFHHRKSQSLILSDLLHNLETDKLPAWLRPVIWFSGTDHPDAAMPPALRRGFRDRDALADQVEQIIAWRPQRIILCHGKWIACDAVAELERAFRKILRDRMWVRALDEIKARER